MCLLITLKRVCPGPPAGCPHSITVPSGQLHCNVQLILSIQCSLQDLCHHSFSTPAINHPESASAQAKHVKGFSDTSLTRRTTNLSLDPAGLTVTVCNDRSDPSHHNFPSGSTHSLLTDNSARFYHCQTCLILAAIHLAVNNLNL